jgi:hypothetical protein
MNADHKAILEAALDAPEGQQFQADYAARVAELSATAGFSAPGPDAVDWTNVIGVITKLAPVIFSLIGGWSPAALVAIIPQIIGILFPGLDANLVTMIQTFLTFLLSKIPQPA